MLKDQDTEELHLCEEGNDDEIWNTKLDLNYET
jgi:hypothetical protein